MRKALKWRVEYLDLATSIPNAIEADLVSRDGPTLIIASYHDLLGGLYWSSTKVEQLYDVCCGYGDVVELISLATSQKDNYELENFGTTIDSGPSALPFMAINTGTEGHFSRVRNRFLSPFKHDLLPKVASPSQSSVAEINKALAIMGEIPKRTLSIFEFAKSHIIPRRQFFEKCLNELSLPHMYSRLRGLFESALTAILASSDFGGAVFHTPVIGKPSFLTRITSGGPATGFVDTICGENRDLVGHNSTAKGIRNTLTREFVPSAYAGHPVLLVSRSFPAVATAIHALKSLSCGIIFAVGLTVPPASPLADNTQHCQSLDSSTCGTPFTIVSALEGSDSQLLTQLLRFVGNRANLSREGGGTAPIKMLLDLGSEEPDTKALRNGEIEMGCLTGIHSQHGGGYGGLDGTGDDEAARWTKQAI